MQVILASMHRFLLFLTMILSATTLAGCGFTLRGSVNLAGLENLYLESSVGESEILQELRRSLLAGDVNILDSPQQDVYRLGIGEEQTEERVLSVNSNARAGEYELSISVPVQLRRGDVMLFGPEILTIEKVYLADPNSAVAKDEERELMEGEIRQELISQILRRLQNLTL